MENQSASRPSWDEYFMGIVKQVATRATCDRGKSGCIIVRDKQILTTGYVGSPKGVGHCDELGHQFQLVTHEDGHTSQHCIRTTHAEQNAICQAAKLGIALEGATLYCKMTPCYACAKMIINVGIRRVVCENDYHSAELSKEIFSSAGVGLEIINPAVEQYAKQ